jgi:hypothetical protein
MQSSQFLNETYVCDEQDTPYSNIVVPNNYTAQFTYMIELLVPQRKHVLMCGPTGNILTHNLITYIHAYI